MIWDKKHLIDVDDLSKEEICSLLNLATKYKQNLKSKPPKKMKILEGYTTLNMFFEPSTRTRISFELAAKKLGANSINFSPQISSVLKGETLIDTIETINAMYIDLIVIRHPQAGIPHLIKKHFNGSIINAGDGIHAHPTQALLDCLSIFGKFGSFQKLHVVMVGDILHSRCDFSLLKALKVLESRVSFVGPPTLLPDYLNQYGVDQYFKLDDVIETADILYLDRIQSERMDKTTIPSISEWINLYGVDYRRIEKLKENLIIMHSGPISRNVEISSDLAYCDQSLILDEVTCGVALRMALLQLLLKGEKTDD